MTLEGFLKVKERIAAQLEAAIYNAIEKCPEGAREFFGFLKGK